MPAENDASLVAAREHGRMAAAAAAAGEGGGGGLMDESPLAGGVDEDDWLRDGGGQFQRTNDTQGCTIQFDTSAHRRRPLGVGRTRDGESHDASRAMPGGIVRYYARCNVDAPFVVGHVAAAY